MGMNPYIVSLDKVCPWETNWCVQVKVLSLWKESAVGHDVSGVIVQMVLMDNELNKVQATIREELIPKYLNKLQEGSCYILRNFSVVPNSGLVRITHHRFRIFFEYDTILTLCPNFSISNSGLSLYTLEQLLHRTVDHDYLIDFIGIVTLVGKERCIEYDGKLLRAVKLELFAERQRIECNIVGDCSDSIDFKKFSKYQRPPVLILRYFKVRVDAGKVILQNVMNVSRILVNPDMEESVHFLNSFHIASQSFSRLMLTQTGSLVSKVDDETFDWTLLRTITNLKSDNEDGEVFVLGEIKRILDDPEWWLFACVCGQPIVGDDNVFYCQLCRSEIEHIIIKFRVKVLVEDGTSGGVFILLDSAATKLFGKTCSDTFLQLEEDIEKIDHPYGPSLFDDLVGQKVVMKVQPRRIHNQIYGGVFKVVNIIRDVPFFQRVEPTSSSMGLFPGSTFRPIFQDSFQLANHGGFRNEVISDPSINPENIKDIITHTLSLRMCASSSRLDKLRVLVGKVTGVIPNQKWWSLSCVCDSAVCRVGNVFYCGLCRVECVGALPSFRLKVFVTHSNGSNIFVLDDAEVEQVLQQICSQLLGEQVSCSEEFCDYVVPGRIRRKFLDKKFLFVVDSRPIGYDLEKSLHIVRGLSNEPLVINFFEGANNVNEQQLYELRSGSAHIPLESNNGIPIQSVAQNDSVSSSSHHLSTGSPTSVLDWTTQKSHGGTYHIFAGGGGFSGSSGRVQNDCDLSIVDCLRIGVEHFVREIAEPDQMDESHV